MYHVQKSFECYKVRDRNPHARSRRRATRQNHSIGSRQLRLTPHVQGSHDEVDVPRRCLAGSVRHCLRQHNHQGTWFVGLLLPSPSPGDARCQCGPVDPSMARVRVCLVLQAHIRCCSNCGLVPRLNNIEGTGLFYSCRHFHKTTLSFTWSFHPLSCYSLSLPVLHHSSPHPRPKELLLTGHSARTIPALAITAPAAASPTRPLTTPRHGWTPRPTGGRMRTPKHSRSSRK